MKFEENLFQSIEAFSFDKKKSNSDTSNNSKDFFDLKTELQSELIRQTIEHAYSRIPYYNYLFKDLNIDLSNLERSNSIEYLKKIPILTKDMLVSQTKDFVNPYVHIVSIKNTSGTTLYGEQLGIYISQEELKAIHSYNYLEYEALRQTTEDLEITLRITVRRQGVSPIPPNLVIVVPYLLEDTNRIVSIMTELRRNHYIPNCIHNRVSIINLPTPWIGRLITKELIERNYDLKSLKIKAITSSGGHASQSLRKYIKELWNADFYSSYNMAEVCGSATECQYHNGYHFDIKIYPTAFEPFTKKIVPYGEEGVLVLTTLYPFQQANPLLNYWTNDIVVLTDNECKCGYKGITISKFIGRVEYCKYFGDLLDKTAKKKWFSYIDVLEVIDEIPELIFDRARFKIEYKKTTNNYEIIIKVCLACEISKERENEIRDFLISGIEKRYLEWKNLFSSKEICINIDFINIRLQYYSTNSSYFRV